jgi:homoserine O-acetyltransferase
MLTALRRIHKLVLDHLGVSSVAAVIGGSMGGMAVLEWPLVFPGLVRHIVALATSARHSAWCISWGEAQRQSIYSDPGFQDGWYTAQPAQGLGAARMAALLTYRSRDSFEARFGRRAQRSTGVPTPPRTPRGAIPASPSGEAPPPPLDGTAVAVATAAVAARGAEPPRIFNAQSYLRYQGDKFISRFDANCYVHITRKLDTHDLGRPHADGGADDEDASDEVRDAALVSALGRLPPRALVMGVQSDGLFTLSEQRFIAAHAPAAELVVIPSPDGHDGFLLEFELINAHILRFLRAELPEYYAAGTGTDVVLRDDFAIKKTSMFGEAEADITRW